MRPLLLLLVLIAGVWLWRSRQGATDRSPPATPKPRKPLDMVSCSRCGMHIPGDEIVIGKQGAYCSVDHLQQSES